MSESLFPVPISDRLLRIAAGTSLAFLTKQLLYGDIEITRRELPGVLLYMGIAYWVGHNSPEIGSTIANSMNDVNPIIIVNDQGIQTADPVIKMTPVVRGEMKPE
ncbi:hypothetical protein HY469_02875 [Candidatus Roizmanbacteria bacterium]|nr:hypothetical protein [Candidatus Roizmanbacteria bacterium]